MNSTSHINNTNTNVGIFSFFAGCGLLDLGFESEGFESLFVNEFFAPFMDGYKHSRRAMGLKQPTYGYNLGSIEEVKGEELVNIIDAEHKKNKLVGFIGGPPCPDFSVAGKNKGQHGVNGRLSQSYVDLICENKPDFFLFENVKGLWRTKKHRQFYDEMKIKLAKHGYHFHEKLINSIEYGAAQDRFRIILIGFKNDSFRKGNFSWEGLLYPGDTAFSFSWPSKENFEIDSVVEAPNNIPYDLTVESWFVKNDVINHPNSKHCFTPRAGLKRFMEIQEGDDSKKSYKRLHRYRYSPTAAYGNNEVHLHPYKARRLTVSEALAIQSAPINFELPDTMTLSAMFKTVGNAVPFLAAKGIAASIKRYIEENAY